MAEYINRDRLYKFVATCKGLIVVNHVAATEAIDNLLADAVAPVRHGRWEGEGDGYAETDYGEMALVYDVWSCSECGHIIDDGTDDPELLPNYCPNCGAKMEGDEDDG